MQPLYTEYNEQSKDANVLRMLTLNARSCGSESKGYKIGSLLNVREVKSLDIALIQESRVSEKKVPKALLDSLNELSLDFF